MAEPAVEPKVINNTEHNRYELWLGERLAAFSVYREDGDQTVFLHTVVDEAMEGRGLGSVLAKAALDDTVHRGHVIVPLCPFIAHYLRKTTEYDVHVRWPSGE